MVNMVLGGGRCFGFGCARAQLPVGMYNSAGVVNPSVRVHLVNPAIPQRIRYCVVSELPFVNRSRVGECYFMLPWAGGRVWRKAIGCLPHY